MPKPPAEPIKAPAKPTSYPSFTIAGIINTPRAATVAGPLPEIAAKIIAAKTATIARPPRMRPTNSRQKLISRREIPPIFIMLPASMKNGTASSERLLVES